MLTCNYCGCLLGRGPVFTTRLHTAGCVQEIIRRFGLDSGRELHTMPLIHKLVSHDINLISVPIKFCETYLILLCMHVLYIVNFHSWYSLWKRAQRKVYFICTERSNVESSTNVFWAHSDFSTDSIRSELCVSGSFVCLCVSVKDTWVLCNLYVLSSYATCLFNAF